MNKRVVSVLALIAALLVGSLCLAACGDENTDTVYTMEAAYEKAYDLGYEGSIDEFKASVNDKREQSGKKENDFLEIKNIALNAEFELIIVYVNDLTINLGVVIPRCNHVYGDWETALEETCTALGYNKRECEKCGNVDYEFLPASGHDYDDGETVIVPSCTNTGLKVYKCADCSDIKNEILAKKDHETVKYPASAPTCTSVGWDEYEACKDCSYTTYSEIAFEDHVYDGGTTIVKATCEYDGLDIYTCIGCGHTKSDIINILPHEMESFAAKAPTCIDMGWERYEACANCSYTTMKKIKPKGHTVVNGVCTDCGMGGVFTVSYAYNYKGAPNEIFTTVRNSGGNRPVEPMSKHERKGYRFVGWSKTEAGKNFVDFQSDIVSSDVTYYAVWALVAPVVVSNGIFDAEFTYIDSNETFPGFNGSATGKNIICSGSDATTQHLFGSTDVKGYYVDYLYKKGATLRFVIHSSVAVESATLKARLGCLSEDTEFTPNGENALKFKVNGQSVDYSAISLRHGESDSIDFEEVTIGSIALTEGENIIEIVVDNSNPFGGTAMAHAPVVDFIKLENTGDAVLSWAPEYDNIYG